MIQDSNGIEIKPGDFVMARFRVKDLIPDSENLNLLVVHAEGHAGVPDDWRLELQSSQVIRMDSDVDLLPDKPPSLPDKPPSLPHKPLARPKESPEEEPEETPHRGKHK